MKSLSASLQTRYATIQEPKPKSKISNQRQEIVKMFLDRLNAAREGTKYKPLTPAFVGMKLSVFKTAGELHQFFGTCSEAKNFSSYFFWSLNPKNYPLDKK